MFWWIMLVCNLLIPVLSIVGGILMWKKCPKEINHLIGYRTKNSMKNEDTWKFAHSFCGKFWLITGLVMLFASAGVLIPFYGASQKTISTVILISVSVQCVLLVISLIATEIALKMKFSSDGTRK